MELDNGHEDMSVLIGKYRQLLNFLDLHIGLLLGISFPYSGGDSGQD